MITGTQLRTLRNFKDLKQHFIAIKLGVSQSTYSEWECSSEINGQRLQSLLRVLELTEEQAREILRLNSSSANE